MMGNKNHNIKSNKAIKNCLLVLLSFITLNVFGSVGAFQIDTDQSLSVTDFHSSLQVDNQTDDFAHHSPFRSPTEPNPIPGKGTDEKDNLDEDEWGKSYTFSDALSGICDFDEKYSNQAIKQLDQAIANQKRISLFILYHCWKSFLI